jgi:hypothetical protein
MLGKIRSIETKQKKQIEGIKFILDNGNIKNKPDSNKILSGDTATSNPFVETPPKYKSSSTQPKYNYKYPSV